MGTDAYRLGFCSRQLLSEFSYVTRLIPPYTSFACDQLYYLLNSHILICVMSLHPQLSPSHSLKQLHIRDTLHPSYLP